MKRPVISITIISLAVILLAFFVILPEYEALNSKNLQVEEKKSEFKKINDYFEDLSLQNEELEKYELEIAKIDSALPDNPSMPSVFYFIQNTAEENEISLTEVNMGYSRIKEGIEESEILDIKENRFSVSVVGSYSSFKDFLSVLEKSARLIEIEEIYFSSFGKTEATTELIVFSPSEDIFSFDLEMKVYSY